MKKHYDFSKGIKGKFYVPEDEINLPIYLEENNREYYMKLAKNNKVGISKLVNNMLSKDKEIIESALKK